MCQHLKPFTLLQSPSILPLFAKKPCCPRTGGGVRLVRIRIRVGNAWQAPCVWVCVCEGLCEDVRESGGSTINFHEFLLETIDGIYFVIYLVKWLPRSLPLSLSFALFCLLLLFCLRLCFFCFGFYFFCFCLCFCYCFCFCFCISGFASRFAALPQS